jgi:hypothetical protein
MESKTMVNQEFVKLDRFHRTNFVCWKDKMMFMLTLLKIFYILDLNLSEIFASTLEDNDQLKASVKNEIKMNCFAEAMSSIICQIVCIIFFTFTKSLKKIWKSLEYKYNIEKQGVDKFLIIKYFKFSIIDNISVMNQVHELQVLIFKLKDLKVEVLEALETIGIIAKFPLSWNDYRKKLLYTTKELFLEQIQKHLRIEKEIIIHV